MAEKTGIIEEPMCDGERGWREIDRQVEQWLTEHPNWLDEPSEDDPILAKLYRAEFPPGMGTMGDGSKPHDFPLAVLA